MMPTAMAVFARLALAGVVLALAGCVATDFGPLNSTYSTLSNREAEATRLDRDSKAYAEAKDELAASYKELAIQAYDLSKDTGQKPATRVAALRLAAVSAWKGDDDDIYGKAQPEGERACDQLPAGTAGAPRDCAFLKYLPTLKAYDQLAKAYNDKTTAGPARAAKLLALLPNVDALRSSQETLLPQVNGGAGHFAGIAPSTQAFFRKFAFASACLAKLYYTVGNTTNPKTQEAIQLSNDGKDAAGRYSQLLVEAQELPAPDPTWYSTSAIVCTGTPQ